ncbi:36926_t:CDS:1 [Gigaspora margarita]|uniref:36926_t:CDS:1 n=1 Tax=Gigaspora margarita TaxID=4874 RepID=A0ABN7VHM4_GIGMA|nr:36926_t:CDS:1 [Gigaspora margarita]
MGDLHLIFPTILNILHDALNSEIQIKCQIVQRIYKKLGDYWAILRNCCSISVVLDPTIKLLSFDDETAPIIRDLMYSIYARYSNENICSSSSSSTLFLVEDANNSRNYFRQFRNDKSKNNTHYVLEEYLTAIEENCNLLDFWKT